ncbi:7921_t:CDS:2 [Entrophospora sp. SA101]|nr:7921_t:CDS:2 [Entrophospora sp. SA101]
MVEQLTLNQEVGGSNPLQGTKERNILLRKFILRLDTPTPKDNKDFVWEENLQKQIASQEKEIQILTEKIAKWRKLVENLREENDKLRNEQKTNEEFHDQVQQKLLELTGEIEVINLLETKLEYQEKKHTDWQSHLQNKLEYACQEILKDEKELTKLNKKNNQLQRRLQQSKQKLTSQLRVLTKTSEKLTNSRILVNSFNHDNQLYQDEVKSLESSLLDKEQQISQQQQIITDKTNEINQLQGENNSLKQVKQDLKSEINNLKVQHKKEVGEKEKKITDLERIIQELRNKPPLQPVNSSDKSENKSEPNNFLIEKESLLAQIQQQKETIRQLHNQLKNNQQSRVIVKEVPVTDLITINELQEKLKIKETSLDKTQIPSSKNIFIALTYIYGIGRSLAEKITEETEINKYKKTKDLTEEEIKLLNEKIKNFSIEGKLKEETQKKINEQIRLGTYQGLRRSRKPNPLPIHGQRTRHNARTAKGDKSKVKKIKKVAEGRGIIHGKFSFNNTILRLTKENGDALGKTISAGSIGFKNTKKGTPYAAQKVAEEVIKRAAEYGISNVETQVKGIGAGRDAVMKRILEEKSLNNEA